MSVSVNNMLEDPVVGCGLNGGQAFCSSFNYNSDLELSCFFGGPYLYGPMITSGLAVGAGLFKLVSDCHKLQQWRDQKLTGRIEPINSEDSEISCKTQKGTAFALVALSTISLAVVATSSTLPGWISEYWNDEVNACLKEA